MNIPAVEALIKALDLMISGASTTIRLNDKELHDQLTMLVEEYESLQHINQRLEYDLDSAYRTIEDCYNNPPIQYGPSYNKEALFHKNVRDYYDH